MPKINYLPKNIKSFSSKSLGATRRFFKKNTNKSKKIIKSIENIISSGTIFRVGTDKYDLTTRPVNSDKPIEKKKIIELVTKHVKGSNGKKNGSNDGFLSLTKSPREVASWCYLLCQINSISKIVVCKENENFLKAEEYIQGNTIKNFAKSADEYVCWKEIPKEAITNILKIKYNEANEEFEIIE